MQQIVIVGGGAAGLAASIEAAREVSRRGRRDIAITVLDAADVPGRKLLATGNGKCNLSNRLQSRACYRSGDGVIPERFYQSDWDVETEQFMRSVGVLLHERRGGYLYPRTDQASTVQQALLRSAEHLGISMVSGYRVLECAKRKDGRYQLVPRSARAGKYAELSGTGRCGIAEGIAADRVIIASGGMVSKGYCCSGDGYSIAQELGHSLVHPVPALCALTVDSRNIRLAGSVRAAGRITLVQGSRVLASSEGELQLTEHGISGIPAFQLSRYAAFLSRVPGDAPQKESTAASAAKISGEGTSSGKAELIDPCSKLRNLCARLDFLPELTEEEWEAECERRLCAIQPDDTLGDFCRGLLPDKAAAWLLADRNLVREKKIANLNLQDGPEAPRRLLRQILDDMRRKTVRVTGTDGFERAQATAGGIPLAEITDTMESKRAPGCYFAGEILDVDGMCGGYNLTWAFHSGLLSGRSAAASLCR